MKPPIRRLFTPRLAALSGPSMQRVGPTTHLHDMGNYQGIGKPGEGILLQVDYSRATLSPSRYSSFASVATHARASTATGVVEGVVEDFLPDVPRFVGSVGSGFMLLKEDAATNLVEDSVPSIAAGWEEINAVITDDVKTAPDGSMGPSVNFTPSGSTSLRYTQLGQKDKTITVSIFLSLDGASFINMYGYSNGGPGVVFDLQSKTYNIIGNWSEAGIEQISANWVRVWMKGAVASNAFYMVPVEDINGTSLAIARSIGVWGFDSKEGDISSYIPTAGAAATRAADFLSYSNVPAVNETRVEIEGEADSDTDDWDGTVDETGNLEILTVYGTGMRP